jgi:pectinesterase
MLFENCKILGNQDTVYAAGERSRQYFDHCYIEGTTDFIFGEATVIFNDCEIHSKANSFITAASTPEEATYGFVFINCKLTATAGLTKVHLGRPRRKFAKTVFISCEMGQQIIPEGWHNLDNKEAEKTSFYAEYQSAGPGADSTTRVAWSHQLSPKDAAKYSVEAIFSNRVPAVIKR